MHFPQQPFGDGKLRDRILPQYHLRTDFAAEVLTGELGLLEKLEELEIPFVRSENEPGGTEGFDPLSIVPVPRQPRVPQLDGGVTIFREQLNPQPAVRSVVM